MEQLKQTEQAAADLRAAISLQKEEGWKEAVKIADELIRDFEQQALQSSDAGEIIRCAGEAKGARKMRDRLLKTITEIEAR
jgi:predicted Zn-dependent protease